MLNGLMMVGLPEPTVKLLIAVSRKTGKTMVDVLGDAVHQYVKKNLNEIDIKQIDLEIKQEIKSRQEQSQF